MARLYDRILAAHPKAPPALLRSPCVVVDNVAAYGEASGITGDGFKVQDTPNLAPPFPDWWMEARGVKEGDPTQFGALMTGRVASADDRAGMRDEFRRLLLERPEIYDDRIRSAAPPYGHFFVGAVAFVAGGTGWPAIPSPVGAFSMMLEDDGSLPSPGVMRFELTPIGERLDPDRLTRLFGLMKLLWLGVSFMHCKNVERREVAQPAFDRQVWHKKHKRPLVRYHVLDIDPMRKVLKHEGGADVHGLKKALHICRGHFATYTEEAPLFGRVTGTFWKPQHVRGNAKSGAVVKDYNVKAPR